MKQFLRLGDGYALTSTYDTENKRLARGPLGIGFDTASEILHVSDSVYQPAGSPVSALSADKSRISRGSVAEKLAGLSEANQGAFLLNSESGLTPTLPRGSLGDPSGIPRVYLGCGFSVMPKKNRGDGPDITAGCAPSIAHIPTLKPNTFATFVAVVLALFMCLTAAKQVSAQAEPADAVNKQLQTITGTVVDTIGQPIQGATVSVVGTNQQAISDNDGAFRLTVSVSVRELQVSCLGFTTGYVKLGGQSHVEISLYPDFSLLDEVITIGYGKTTKRYNTGSVGKVSEGEIKRQPVTNVLASMAGRIPGVFVKTENGLPGGEISIQVRGRGSIEAGTQPLYIVDGVPLDATPLNSTNSDFQNINGRISPLNSLSPSEIESIEVLKDADATAIYGSRGTNGVVIITTKTGGGMRSHVDFSFHSSVSSPSLMPKILGFEDHVMLREEGFRNDGITPTVSSAPDLMVWSRDTLTDWSAWVMGHSAPSNHFNVAVNNINEHSSLKFGLHHHDEATVLSREHRYRRTGGSLSYRMQSKDSRWTFLLNSQYTRDDNNTVKLSSFASVYAYPHNYPLYNEDGQLNWTLNNPLAWRNQPAKTENEFFSTNATIAYNLLPNLELKLIAGFNSMRLDMHSAQPASTGNPQFAPESQSNFGENTARNYLLEPNLNYTKTIGETTFSAMVGGTWQYSNTAGYSIRGVGYSSESMLGSLAAAREIGYRMDNLAAYKYLSGYARLNINSLKRYLLNISFRRDGSSKFGLDRRYGNFGAIGVGWIFSEESFFKNHVSWLSFGKLRSSYGIVGNDQIGNYRYMSSYAPNQLYLGRLTIQPQNIDNERFGWETTRKIEVALEAGFFGQRLNTEIGYFRHVSDNQLISYPLPAVSGPFGSYQSNFPGKVLNDGWEFSVDAVLLKQGIMTWSTAFNLTLPRNELLSFPGIENTSYANLYEVGKDLNIIKGFDYTGIDPQTGIPTFTDMNQDGVITAANDRVVIGKMSPDWYGGWNNTFTINDISLHIFLQFVGQQSRISTFDYIPGRINVPNEYALKRWQKPGDITDVPIAAAQSGTEAYRAITNLNNSSAAIVDGTFIRGKNIALSYKLPEKTISRVRIRQADISLRLQNAFTFFDRTKSNRDPETTNGSAATIPLMKTYSLGVNLTF